MSIDFESLYTRDQLKEIVKSKLDAGWRDDPVDSLVDYILLVESVAFDRGMLEVQQRIVDALDLRRCAQLLGFTLR